MSFVKGVKEVWKEDKDFRGFVKWFVMITVGSSVFAVVVTVVHWINV